MNNEYAFTGKVFCRNAQNVAALSEAMSEIGSSDCMIRIAGADGIYPQTYRVRARDTQEIDRLFQCICSF